MRPHYHSLRQEQPDISHKNPQVALLAMSVMSRCNSFIINHGISSPEYDKEVVDVINVIDKRYIYIN